MNSLSAQTLLDSIDQTIKDIDSISGSNVLTDSYLAKFLVVYISGIYEEVVESILIDFTTRNTKRPEVVAYMSKQLERHFQNPKFGRITELVELFGNATWNTEIKKLSVHGTALDSIVANKNALAHGQSSTITLVDVKQYYQNSRPIFMKIDSLFI